MKRLSDGQTKLHKTEKESQRAPAVGNRMQDDILAPVSYNYLQGDKNLDSAFDILFEEALKVFNDKPN